MIIKQFIWKREINSIIYRCYYVAENDMTFFYLTTDNGLHIRKDGTIDYKDVVYHSEKECNVISFLLDKLK